MSNLARHKDYYLRGWRSNVRAEIEVENAASEKAAAAKGDGVENDVEALFKFVD